MSLYGTIYLVDIYWQSICARGELVPGLPWPIVVVHGLAARRGGLVGLDVRGKN